ncbi:alpha/beta hydrolase [Pseudaestuariivita atlantica]|uniref:alpha/beta hydrolase n=1 Tax=Pseudaestuariivita atlantica TaxID=1317121 RepID=UPI00067ABFC4|nr:alpha/beta hydrolase [Pseudaestuariivita atlantica]
MRALALLIALWPAALSAQGLLDLLPLGWLERKMLYAFSPLEETPESVGLAGVTAQRVGESVGWSAPPRRAGGPVIFYLHGNAGNLAIRAERFAAFQRQGFGFVAPAYRGSSGTPGQPGEAALVADAMEVWRAVPRLVPEGGGVVIYGESLGSAVAVALVAEGARPGGVILEAPFTSIPDMARAVTDMPDHLIARIRDTWDTRARAAALDVPLLVVHGTADAVVPVAMGREVFGAAASRDKDFMAVPGAGHLNVWQRDVTRRIWRFVEAYGR